MPGRGALALAGDETRLKGTQGQRGEELVPGWAGRPSGKDAVGPRTRVCEPEAADHGGRLDYLKLVPTHGKKSDLRDTQVSSGWTINPHEERNYKPFRDDMERHLNGLRAGIRDFLKQDPQR